MRLDNPSKADNISAVLSPSYSPILIMQCEQLLSVISNKTAILNTQQLTPPYIRQLLARQNLTLRVPKTVSECVIELSRILNSTNEIDAPNPKIQQNYGIQEHSRSLIVFVILIAFVSFISIIGNVCLAKVLYSKRFRLLQTDRIVLCLALSELCLVLIDSPTEIYRFLSYSFSQTWLCRFHTFFESLFSSCIIFYHLLGAFDRFVYIHGHTPSNVSSWSKWCRRISTKSGSIILLILPILCSLPIAVCNLLHAHVLYTSSEMKICVVQYNHGILISFLIFFNILPLLFSFFLHAKLIYFIRSKHHRHYLTTAFMLPIKNNNTLDSQTIIQKKRRVPKSSILINNQQLLQPKLENKKAANRRVVMFNRDTNGDTVRTGMTTTTTTGIAGQQVGINNSSNSSASSRSSAGTCSASLTSPIILYKVNSQANANANRTVLLLVLLLSFYVLCWAPYNIYTWRNAYQLTTNNPNQTFSNQTVLLDSNQTTTFSMNSLHADLRRIIFINYSLYLLSMISMCFSFIFYFSLNKHARYELSRAIGCVCPWFVDKRQDNRRKIINAKQQQEKERCLQYHTRYQHNYSQNKLIVSSLSSANQRVKTTKFNTHPMMVQPTPLLIDRQYNRKRLNSSQAKFDNALSRRTVLTYGCHVQCCP